MNSIPRITLNDGNEMPQLGYGVFQIPEDDAVATVASALAVGYRSIDTATIYRNERAVGQAIRESGIPRDDIFVTTKVWSTDQGYDSTLAAFEASMERLGLERLDLYLIHWPAPARDLYLETWKALEQLRADGRVTSIGVSNFRVTDLERLLAESDVVPAVNQIELHPLLIQAELRDFHARHGIATEAWSPLAQAEVLEHPVLLEVAAATGRTAAQVVLRWHIQLGTIVIPKTATPARMRENFAIFDFELTSEQVEMISALDAGTRTGLDPNTFNG